MFSNDNIDFLKNIVDKSQRFLRKQIQDQESLLNTYAVEIRDLQEKSRIEEIDLHKMKKDYYSGEATLTALEKQYNEINKK